MNSEIKNFILSFGIKEDSDEWKILLKDPVLNDPKTTVDDKRDYLDEIGLLIKLSQLKIGSSEWESLSNKLFFSDPKISEENKNIFLDKINNMKANNLSMELYIQENKGREIISYDSDNFMPIYEGVEKWSPK